MTPETDRSRWVALVVCCSAMFMTLLDVSVTNVALPSIGNDTGAGSAELQWIVSGYTLAFGLVPVLGGKLGDDHGRRLMFQVGVAGFVVTSALSGLAPTAGILIGARVLQGLFGGLINPQTSGLVQQMFQRRRPRTRLRRPRHHGRSRHRGRPDRRRAADRPRRTDPRLAAGLLHQHPDRARRARALAPAAAGHDRHRRATGSTCSARPCSEARRSASSFACVEYDALRDVRLAWLAVPTVVLLGLFLRRERRLTREDGDPLVDLRLFRRPSYVSGITLALAFFPAMAGLPLVLALYYQRGLGYTALESALGVTAYAVGSAVSAPLAGRVVTRIGRPLVVGGAVTFGLGAIALAVVASHVPDGHATLALAPPLFVMGCGQGALITPNQTLALMDVDPQMGSTAGGVLQTGQRIGLAIGQALIGAVFFSSLTGSSAEDYARALGHAVVAAICFVAVSVAIGVNDLLRARRRTSYT